MGQRLVRLWSEFGQARPKFGQARPKSFPDIAAMCRPALPNVVLFQATPVMATQPISRSQVALLCVCGPVVCCPPREPKQ